MRAGFVRSLGASRIERFVEHVAIVLGLQRANQLFDRVIVAGPAVAAWLQSLLVSRDRSPRRPARSWSLHQVVK
jgi:hypothetical protein